MPEVKLPPVKNNLSDIELFAIAYFRVQLTGWQLQYIRSLVNDSPIRGGKQMGRKTAEKILKLYIAEGTDRRGRARIPRYPIPMIDRKRFKGYSQHRRILEMIKRPSGAYNFELSRYALKYTSVISELRKDGHNIIAERQYHKNGKASNTFLYRLGG